MACWGALRRRTTSKGEKEAGEREEGAKHSSGSAGIYCPPDPWGALGHEWPHVVSSYLEAKERAFISPSGHGCLGEKGCLSTPASPGKQRPRLTDNCLRKIAGEALIHSPRAAGDACAVYREVWAGNVEHLIQEYW